MEPEIQPTAAELAHPAGSLSAREARGVKTAEDYRTRMVTAWKARNIDAKWEVVEGVAGASIVNFAHSHAVDVIAMSPHGRSGLSRLISDSVADQ